MKNWLNKNYKTLIVSAFLIPIITVALVSISHVTEWYGISNPLTWSIYLSVGIEIAALSALAAISANMGKKVYFPFLIVTLIQFIGNIYFAYSHISIDGESFKMWVELVSPLLELLGIEPTDLIAHKRFLSLFAGGMLPIISLSFLHMLVKFTEEDKSNDKKEIIDEKMDVENEITQDKIDSKDLVAEVSRLRLSEDDLNILEKFLSKPPLPNDNLKNAAKEYEKQIEEEDVVSDDEINEVFSTMSLNNETTFNDNLPAENVTDNESEHIVPSYAPTSASEMMISTNEDIINSIPSDEEISEWDLEGIDESVVNDQITDDIISIDYVEKESVENTDSEEKKKN